MAFEQIIQFNDSITYSWEKNKVLFIRTMNFNKYSKHLVQLLKKNKFEEFSNHINPKLLLKNCKVSDKGKEFDCENILSNLILKQNRLNFYCNLLFSNWNSTQNNLTLNNRERFKNLEKITIKSRRIKEIYLSVFHNSEEKYISESSQSFVISNSANIYFETYSIQKLNTNRYKCSEKINNSYDHSINCVYDCYISYYQNHFGCLPIDLIEFHLILEKDLKTLRFKLCSERIVFKNLSLTKNFKIDERLNYCNTQCIPDCNQLNLIYRTDYLQSTNESEDIIINLMPMNKFVIRFIEIFQNDLNQLIYEFGGIVGLWFGIYPVKAADLLMYSLIPIRGYSVLILIYLKKLILFIKTKLILLLMTSFDTIVYIMKFFILVIHLMYKLVFFVISFKIISRKVDH
jgi:hypothetical protein